MEQPIPQWLDADFMAQCLRHEKVNQNIIVTKIDASLAAPAGNNYGACVARVKVEYKDSENDKEPHFLSLIVKSEVTVGVFIEMMEGVDLGDFKLKEPAFYKRFLPKVKELTNPDFAPKTFFSPKYEVSILEDLKEQGFVMADRLKQLDFEHCRLYMEAAAAFHASSIAVHKHDPKLVEKLGEPIDFSKFEFYSTMIKLGFQCFAGATGKIERFKKHQKLVEDFTDRIWDILRDVQKPTNILNSLTQGDPWTTNMMFKYDNNGAVCDVKLLDFQALRYTSPVNDVLFFIWSSANHEVRRNRSNELYHIYVEKLNDKLAELKCSERITYDAFMDEVKRLSPAPFYIVAAFLPLLINPSPIDFRIFFPKDGFKDNPYDNYYNESYCRDHVPKLLEQLELAGVFQYMDQHYNEG